MGYSIAVAARSKALRDEMLDFMSEHFREFSEVVGKGESHDMVPTMHLGYDNGKCRIGFNYGPLMPGEREYIFCVLKWMAIRIGKRRKLQVFEHSDVQGSVPYYVYDGKEAIPIPLASEYEAPAKLEREWDGWLLHDEHGWATTHNASTRLSRRILSSALEKLEKTYTKHIPGELKRLSELWEKRK